MRDIWNQFITWRRAAAPLVLADRELGANLCRGHPAEIALSILSEVVAAKRRSPLAPEAGPPGA